MQVNNDAYSPKFGMALRISNGAKASLEKLPPETIEKLYKIGQGLKDTKHYHLNIGDDLSAMISSDRHAFFGQFKNSANMFSSYPEVMRIGENDIVSDNTFVIKTNGGRTVATVARYLPFGDVSPLYHVWNNEGALRTIDDISKLAKVTKILDAAAVERYSQIQTKTPAKEYKSRAIASLLMLFGA